MKDGSFEAFKADMLASIQRDPQGGAEDCFRRWAGATVYINHRPRRDERVQVARRYIDAKLLPPEIKTRLMTMFESSPATAGRIYRQALAIRSKP